MTIHRFFAFPLKRQKDTIFLPADTSKQITRVLRLRKGDTVIVLDGEGKEYIVVLEQMMKESVSGKIIGIQENVAEPKTFITLYQALTPREKFETILQKGTEIGIAAFVPIETKRSLLKKKDIKQEKLNRWQRIAKEAAEQSERGMIPTVTEPLSFEEALLQASKEGTSLLAWEYEQTNAIHDVLQTLPNGHVVSLFIGPEGGFEEQEVTQAKEYGVLPVGLGPRVLRTETAGPLMAGFVLFQKDDYRTARHYPDRK